MEVGSRAFGQNRYQEYTTWKLPSIYVENYSGNVFYDPFHLKRDKMIILLSQAVKQNGTPISIAKMENIHLK